MKGVRRDYEGPRRPLCQTGIAIGILGGVALVFLLLHFASLMNPIILR
jgi:hypothetical protein